MTPRQLHVLLDRRRENVEHQKHLAGVVAAAVVNFSYSPPKPPIRPSDFFTPKARPRLTYKQQRANLRAFLMSQVKKDA